MSSNGETLADEMGGLSATDATQMFQMLARAMLESEVRIRQDFTSQMADIQRKMECQVASIRDDVAVFMTDTQRKVERQVASIRDNVAAFLTDTQREMERQTRGSGTDLALREISTGQRDLISMVARSLDRIERGLTGFEASNNATTPYIPRPPPSPSPFHHAATTSTTATQFSSRYTHFQSSRSTTFHHQQQHVPRTPPPQSREDLYVPVGGYYNRNRGRQVGGQRQPMRQEGGGGGGGGRGAQPLFHPRYPRNQQQPYTRVLSSRNANGGGFGLYSRGPTVTEQKPAAVHQPSGYTARGEGVYTDDEEEEEGQEMVDADTRSPSAHSGEAPIASVEEKKADDIISLLLSPTPPAASSEAEKPNKFISMLLNPTTTAAGEEKKGVGEQPIGNSEMALALEGLKGRFGAGRRGGKPPASTNRATPTSAASPIPSATPSCGQSAMPVAQGSQAATTSQAEPMVKKEALKGGFGAGRRGGKPVAAVKQAAPPSAQSTSNGVESYERAS